MAHGVRLAVALAAFGLLAALAQGAAAQDGPVRLAVPEALRASGLMEHILPRFSLKTQVRVEVVPEGAEADLYLGDTGRAVFADPSRTWHLSPPDGNPDGHPDGHPGARRLADWLTGEVGLRTVTGFAPGGAALFAPPPAGDVQVAVVAPDGDAALGLDVSRATCARCHAVETGGRMNAIGSSPSFAVLRGMEDWLARFETFYVLNPHPAFTQVADVTPPFPADRPSPIAPVELTLAELEAIVAYVAGLPAADLGAPLIHQ